MANQYSECRYKSGDRHGRLMLTGKSYMALDKTNPKRYVEWVCDCNKIGWSLLCNILKEGHTTSCGCLNKEAILASITSHGLAKHPLYKLWGAVVDRCSNPNNIYYQKGVRICDEWKEFLPFYNWALVNRWEKGLQIDKDKLSPHKPGTLYCPQFCCFLTRLENVRNRSTTKMLEYKGEVKPFAEWCDIFSIQHRTAANRIKFGWSAEEALETPTNLLKRNKNAKC